MENTDEHYSKKCHNYSFPKLSSIISIFQVQLFLKWISFLTMIRIIRGNPESITKWSIRTIVFLANAMIILFQIWDCLSPFCKQKYFKNSSFWSWSGLPGDTRNRLQSGQYSETPFWIMPWLFFFKIELVFLHFQAQLFLQSISHLTMIRIPRGPLEPIPMWSVYSEVGSTNILFIILSKIIIPKLLFSPALHIIRILPLFFVLSFHPCPCVSAWLVVVVVVATSFDGRFF